MTTVVLGAGFVGAALARGNSSLVVTNRGGTHGATRFVLEEEATWAALPTTADAAVWTFPAQPLELVQRFHARWLHRVRRVVVLGTTGSYAVPDGAWLDEQAPVQQDVRGPGEAFLRAQGASLLRLAGLWGPQRNPVQWLLQGRIQDGTKHVNLAHVEDVVAAVGAVLVHPAPPTVVNVADGIPRRWRSHVRALQAQGALPPDFTLPVTTTPRHGYRVRNHALRALLPGHHFRWLTPVFAAAHTPLLAETETTLQELAAHTPSHAEELVSAPALVHTLAGLLARVGQGCLDLASAWAQQEDLPPPLSVLEALELLVDAGVVDAGQPQSLARLGRAGVSRDGYTGQDIEALWQCCVDAPLCLSRLPSLR